MKKKLLVLLFSLVTLGLMSCGGGNDVTSSGASAVSAAAPATASASSAITSTLITTTEPKVNGQIDERTGVAPVVAQATIWTVYSNGGCAKSFGGHGPRLTQAQQNACNQAVGIANNCGPGSSYATIYAQCSALGGDLMWMAPNSCFACETPGP